MKTIRLKTLVKVLFLFLGLAFTGTAQETANVGQAQQFLAEVYANCPEYQDEFRLQSSIDCLQRTIFHAVPLGEYPEAPLLSTVQHKNKCNPALDYDLTNFDPAQFNPLKYHFQYFKEGPSYFRVDGHDYIIEIRPRD